MKKAVLEAIDASIIDRVTDRIVAAYQPIAVYLFGSAARGEAVEGSDLDLLIVMDLPKNLKPYEAAGRIRRLFDGWMVPFDILVQSPETFAVQKRVRGQIAHTAVADGKLLFSR